MDSKRMVRTVIKEGERRENAVDNDCIYVKGVKKT